MGELEIPPIYRRLAEAVQAMARRRFKDAVDLLVEAIRDYGGCADAYVQLAIACELACQYDRGRRAIDEAVLCAPRDSGDNALVFGVLGMYRFLEGDRTGAQVALSRCRELGGFFERGAWSAPSPVTLYTPSVLSAVERCGVDVVEAVRDASREELPLWFPDGTLLLEPTAAQSFNDSALASVSYIDWRLRGAELGIEERGRLANTFVASFSAFASRDSEINLWGDFVGQFNEGGLQVHVPDGCTRGSAGTSLEKLPVTVMFRRRLIQKTREAVERAVAKWLESVAHAGIAGEGPITLVAPGVEFRPRAAQFVIDASRSGQRTILWLVLCLLQVCEAQAMDHIYFTPVEGAQLQ